MESKQQQIIFVYRYIWTVKDNPNMCIKVISGLPDEHKAFEEALRKAPEVEKASRVYLHEYDVNLIELYEAVKEKEVTDNEKKAE